MEGHGVGCVYAITMRCLVRSIFKRKSNEMKIFTTLLACCFILMKSVAQPLPGYNQTTIFGTYTLLDDPGGSSNEASSFNMMGGGGGGFGDSRIITRYDSEANLVSAGIFTSTVDFDPGEGVNGFTATGNDGYVQKLDNNGNLLWTKVFGGSASFGINDVAVDSQDNIYVWAYFWGTVDFDPGENVLSVSSTGSTNNCALVKLDSNGNFLWVSHFTGTANGLPTTLYADPVSGDVLACGMFMGTVDFDPGINVANGVSGGSFDGFMVRVSSDGLYVMHQTLGVTGMDVIAQVALDADNNLIMLGSFAGVVDFDPSPGVFTMTSGLGVANTFIAKYGVDGNIEWVKMLGGAYTTGIRFCLDENQNIYYASTMTAGTVDVDPGPDTVPFTNTGNGSVVVKLSSDGGYLHHAGLIGGFYTLTGMQKYVDGGLYVQGYFSGTVDFDSGTGINELTAATNQEFVWMLSSDLDYYSVFTRPGTWPTSIHIKGAQLLVCGVFVGTTDFNPYDGADNHTAGTVYSFYISNFDFCTFQTFGTLDVTSCGDYVSPSGALYTASGVYTDTIPNSIGCDSVLTINLTRIEPLIPSVEIITSSNSICQGDLADVTAIPVNGGNDPAYQWYINDVLYDVQGASLNSILVYNFDEVRVVMTSNESCLALASDTSNVIQFTVGNPGGSAAIFVSASPSNFVCSADTVTFNADFYNPGNNPVFTWTVNGEAVGDNSSELVLANPIDGSVVLCTLQSSDVCLLSTFDQSDAVTLFVTQSVIPEITISGPQIICEAYNMQYAAEVSGEGSNPSINWYVNGSPDPVGTGNALTIGSLLDGDELTAVLINNDFCAEPVFDVSNTIAVELYTGGDPIIAVNPSLYDVCMGEEVTFTASYANGGDTPLFQWYLDGVPVDNENSDTFTIAELMNDAVVMCEFSTSIPCTNSGIVYSDPVTVSVHNPVLTELYFQKCPDETIVVDGVEYATPGFYIDSLNVTFFGCDSIIHITISNVETPNLEVSSDNNVLTAEQEEADYQWLDCNNNFQPVPGATDQTFSPSVTGSYAVELIIGECSFVSECVDITIIGVEEQLPVSFNVFPNPANNVISLLCSEGISSAVIEDMAGKVVYSSNSVQGNRSPVPIDKFESGIYLVRIETASGMRVQSQFVKL